MTAEPSLFDQSQLPSMPRINVINPGPADLATFAAWLKDLATNCDVSASTREARNPFATMGALIVGTDMLHQWLTKLQADEERNLLMLERLRHEERHDRLMTTDAEYAAEFEGDEGDDQ
jgi:hypothetical protein